MWREEGATKMGEGAMDGGRKVQLEWEKIQWAWAESATEKRRVRLKVDEESTNIRKEERTFFTSRA